MANYKLWQSLGFAAGFFIAIPLKEFPAVRGPSFEPSEDREADWRPKPTECCSLRHVKEQFFFLSRCCRWFRSYCWTAEHSAESFQVLLEDLADLACLLRHLGYISPVDGLRDTEPCQVLNG